MTRILGVDEADRYQALYAFFLVLSFVSWGIELVYSLVAGAQRPMGLVADWTGAWVGSAIIAVAFVEVFGVVIANALLKRQRETIAANNELIAEKNKALEASEDARIAAEKERDDLQARLDKLESRNGQQEEEN